MSPVPGTPEVKPQRYIRGVVGLIRWGHYKAGAINGYTIWRTRTNGWQLQATLVAADRFNLGQRPLTFNALLKKGQWIWPIDRLVIADGRQAAVPSGPCPIRAALGEPYREK